MSHPSAKPYMCLGLAAELENIERQTGVRPRNLTLTRKQLEALCEELATMSPYIAIENVRSLPMFQGIPLRVLP